MLQTNLKTDVPLLGHQGNLFQQILKPLLSSVWNILYYFSAQVSHTVLPAWKRTGPVCLRVTGSAACVDRWSVANGCFGFSPISSILLCSSEVERKASSLQECVTTPTSSELVARMLALSSERLTPAMEATSLMSSSSLWTLFQHVNGTITSLNHNQLILTVFFILKCSASLF